MENKVIRDNNGRFAKGSHASVGTQFKGGHEVIGGYKKGHEGWNKGTKQREYCMDCGKEVTPYMNVKRCHSCGGKKSMSNPETKKIIRAKVWDKVSEFRKGKSFKEIFGDKSEDMIKKRTKKMKKLYSEGKLVPWNKGKTSEEDSRINEKENHPMWNGGTSFEPYDKTWTIKLRSAIRKRDNQVCMNCGIHREKLKKALCVHHIDYDKKLSIPQNCISLCQPCHSLTNSNREYWTKLLQDKLTQSYNYIYEEGKSVITMKEN